MTPRPPRLLRLPDGRRLAWAEQGDPAGRPLLLFHGWPGSRLQRLPDADAVAAIGVRLITVDRPGLGYSDPKPGRRLIDWPDDAAALMDHLGMEAVPVVGVSGGGPYACAMAHRHPGRVTRLGLVCPVGPMTRITHPHGVPMWLFFNLMRRAPLLIEPAVELALTRLSHRRMRGVARHNPLLPKGDRAALLDPAVAAMLAADVAEALRQGPRHVMDDARVIGGPWGFSPRAIRVPTEVWHGRADTIVPHAVGAGLARTIPGARLRSVPRSGHHHLVFAHFPRIIRGLLGAP